MNNDRDCDGCRAFVKGLSCQVEITRLRKELEQAKDGNRTAVRNLVASYESASARAEQAEQERDELADAVRRKYKELAAERKFIKDLYECRYEGDKLMIMLERKKVAEQEGK